MQISASYGAVEGSTALSVGYMNRQELTQEIQSEEEKSTTISQTVPDDQIGVSYCNVSVRNIAGGGAFLFPTSRETFLPMRPDVLQATEFFDLSPSSKVPKIVPEVILADDPDTGIGRHHAPG